LKDLNAGDPSISKGQKNIARTDSNSIRSWDLSQIKLTDKTKSQILFQTLKIWSIVY